MIKNINIPDVPSLHFSIFICFSVAVFYVVKTAFILITMQTAKYGNIAELILWVALITLALATAHVRMKDLPATMTIIFKYMFVMFALYLIFPLTLPSNLAVSDLTSIRLSYGHLVFPVLCIMGWWRPGIGVTGLVAAMTERTSLSHIIDQTLSKTDYLPLVEVSLLMIIGAALTPVFQRLNWIHLANQPMTPEDRLDIYEKLTLVAIAVHLSNYFYSGLKKVFLGEHPMSWVLHNETWSLILTAHILGHLPLSIDPALMSIGINSFKTTVLIGNMLIFFGQLLAIISGVRIKWIIIATLFYDLTHILIFFTTGIFFYKWIILNFAIVAALIGIRDKIIPNPLKAIIATMIVVAPAAFFVAKLGWWDTRALNHEKFYAVLDDGTEIQVPTNYYGSFSVTYAQQRRIRDKTDGFFPSGTFGIVFGQDNMRMGLKCSFELPTSEYPDVVSKNFSQYDNAVTRHVIQHHSYILENVDNEGKIPYDFYPHHIWSMPWLFKDFSELDKRRIVAYRYAIEAKCLGYDEGRIIEDVKRRSEYVIQLK